MSIEVYKPFFEKIEVIQFSYDFETLKSNISEIKGFVESVDEFYVSSIYFNEDYVGLNIWRDCAHNKTLKLVDGCLLARFPIETRIIDRAFQCISHDELEFLYEKV